MTTPALIPPAATMAGQTTGRHGHPDRLPLRYGGMAERARQDQYSFYLNYEKGKLIMISELCNQDGIVFNFVDDPMLMVYTPGPISGEIVF